MTFPRYHEYKDSGVAWLGEVPGHWGVGALKRGFDVCLGKMLQNDASGEDDQLAYYLRAANIQWGGVDLSDVKQMWVSPRERKQLALQPGDLLVSEGGDVGRSALWCGELEECYFQNSVNRVRPHSGNSTRFLYYWISTIKDAGYIDILCNKSTIAHFTAEKVAAVPVFFPADEEQSAIAAFLDRETGKIDALVAEQQRLIALLKEKRQAVISHAVTKGLNPFAAMKDSGIAWPGEVPEHWKVVPLKYGCSLLKDGTHLPPARVDGGVPLLSVRNISDGKFWLLEDDSMISQGDYENLCRSFIPSVGDVLLAIVGATIGKAAMVPDGLGQFHIQRSLAIFRPVAAVTSMWLLFVFQSSKFQQLLWEHVGYSAQPGIYLGTLADFRIPVPPVEEQTAITSFLDRETAKLDALTAEAQRGIELLKERRAALISAAVTGKIDVRG